MSNKPLLFIEPVLFTEPFQFNTYSIFFFFEEPIAAAIIVLHHPIELYKNISIKSFFLFVFFFSLSKKIDMLDPSLPFFLNNKRIRKMDENSKHICDVCNSKFSKHKALNNHRRIHVQNNIPI